MSHRHEWFGVGSDYLEYSIVFHHRCAVPGCLAVMKHTFYRGSYKSVFDPAEHGNPGECLPGFGRCVTKWVVPAVRESGGKNQ